MEAGPTADPPEHGTGSPSACELPVPTPVPVEERELRTWRAALLSLVLAALALGPALLPGRALLPQDPRGLSPWAEELTDAEAADVAATNITAVPHRADKLLQFLPFDTAVGRAWRAGRVPSWEPGVLTGIPLVGQGTSRAFYPTAAVFALVSPDRAYAWLYLLHLVLGGTFLYRLARRWGAPEAGALLGTASFTLSGYALAHLHHPMIFNAAVWTLPALEAGTLLASPWVKRWSARPVLWLALATALSWLAGFPQASVLLCYLVAGLAGLYAIEDLRGGRGLPWRKLASVGAGLGLGIALAAVQILPMLETSAGSSREPGTLELLRERAMPPAFALDLVLPGQVAAPGDVRLESGPASRPTFLALATTPIDQAAALSRGVFNHTEVALGFGLWPFIFALASLARLRRCGARTEVVFLWAFGLFGLAVAMGTPLLSRLALALPGFAAGDFKRLLLLPALAGPLLAALGWRTLSLRALAALALSGAVLLLLASQVGAQEPEAFARTWAGLLSARIDAPRELVMAAFDPGEALFNQALITRGLMVAGFVLVGAAIYFRMSRRRDSVAAFIVLTAFELLPISIDVSPAPPSGAFDTPPALVAAALEWGEQRVTPPRLVRLEPPDDPARPRALTDVRLLPPNMPSVFGLADAQGYAPLPPRGIEELFERIEANSTSHGSGLGTLRDPLSLLTEEFPLLACDLVLTTESELPEVGSLRGLSSPRWELLARTGGVSLFVDTHRLPRARLLPPGPGGASPAPDRVRQEQISPSVRIEEFAAGRIRIHTGAELPAWLDVAESWHPRWRATVDGESVNITRSNVAFLGLSVPAGQHEIVLTYREGQLGRGASLLALALLIALGLRLRRTAATN